MLPNAYFSGTKHKWLLDHVPGARQQVANGELAFDTIDSWLIWQLTHGVVHATDVSIASRSMLFNVHNNPCLPRPASHPAWSKNADDTGCFMLMLTGRSF